MQRSAFRAGANSLAKFFQQPSSLFWVLNFRADLLSDLSQRRS